MMVKPIDLTGKRFGRLVAVEFTGESKKNQGRVWKCVCDCGGTAYLTVAILNFGSTNSCGCIVSENAKALGMTNFKHGEGHGRKTKEYRAWTGMKERCKNENNLSYSQYGGRGIKVCDEWQKSYSSFLKDMGRAPAGMSIERKNVDGDYEPSNCEWATPKTQGRNRTNTRFMMVNGLRIKAIVVADEIGVSRNEIYVYERVRRLIKEKYGLHPSVKDGIPVDS